MSLKQRSSNRKTSSVALTDRRGRPIEAPTDYSDLIIASAKIATVSSEPIKLGDEVGARATYPVPPNGSMVFYTNGPQGVSVNLSLIRVPGSGGHNHGGATSAAAAVGTCSPSSFVLSASYPQNVRSVYRASDVCGIVRVISNFSNGTVAENRVEVMIPGLQPIPASIHLKLKPPTVEHPSPYWGAPPFISKLTQLSNLYAGRTGKPITITDGSLPWGGRFDINQNWIPPHHEHTDGHQADIRSNDMTESDKMIFQQIAAQVGLSVLVESDHWHVRG